MGQLCAQKFISQFVPRYQIIQNYNSVTHALLVEVKMLSVIQKESALMIKQKNKLLYNLKETKLCAL